MKSKLIFFMVIVAVLIFLPSVSALIITDTTFFASESNYTIFVDLMVLDQVEVTSQDIIFHNVTSSGTNLTNTNATSEAVATFIGLSPGLTLRNANTATDLFTSTAQAPDFNATFTAGQTIIINPGPVLSTAATACNELISQFSTYPILLGLVGTIILLGAVLFALSTGFIDLKSSGINSSFVLGGLLVVISIAILIVIAIVIFGALCAGL